MKQVLIVLLFLSAQLATAQEEKGISVKPVKIPFTLEAGHSAIQTVHIINHTDKPTNFKLYFEDWRRDSFGMKRYYYPGVYKRSCANWLKINKENVVVDPGKTEDILVRMELPDDPKAVEEMKWTMLFVETIPENKGASKFTGLRTEVGNIIRIAVQITQTPPNITEKDIQMLSFGNTPGEDKKYRITCKNTGQKEIDSKALIEVAPIGNPEKKFTLTPRTFPTFPEQVRVIDFMLPDTLSKGKYTMVGVIDAGDEVPLQASQAVIEIK